MARNRITYTESFSPTMPAVVRRILAAGLGNEYKYQDDEMQALAAAPEATRDYLSYEIQRCANRVSCTLYVNIRSNYKETLDDDGNEWTRHSLTTDVAWPSHGTTTLAAAAARVELYGEVVRLATRLEAEFGGRELMHLNRTAAKIAEQNARAAANRAQLAAEALAKDGMAAGLRVGGMSGSRKADGIPAGTYPISVDSKRFILTVSDDNGHTMAILGRIADAVA